ncbi:hypothetical protein [Streptomyces sp. 4F14]|uniref:hypothetical protein n=1 Tax=Streptomyces sp. 4F14 TaxID=3394380 RepID=UPI003A83E84C
MTAHDVALRLPDITALRDHCRSLAVLEAILSPAWGDRWHSFDTNWSETEEAAMMRNGSGDEYSIVFSPAGAYLRGFAHESPMTPYGNDGPWPGVLDEVPEVFAPYVDEPAFSDEDGMPVVTVCLWRRTGDEGWSAGAIDFPESFDRDPDGATSLFALLTDRGAEAFQEWAQDYYETEVDLAAIRHVLASRPLTEDVVTRLNPEASLSALAKELAGAGYPRA